MGANAGTDGDHDGVGLRVSGLGSNHRNSGRSFQPALIPQCRLIFGIRPLTTLNSQPYLSLCYFVCLCIFLSLSLSLSRSLSLSVSLSPAWSGGKGLAKPHLEKMCADQNGGTGVRGACSPKPSSTHHAENTPLWVSLFGSSRKKEYIVPFMET